jgi:hypothetical protein
MSFLMLINFISIRLSMTWAGKQGFQNPIAEDSFLVDGVGAMGTSHLERKLAYVEVALSGHMAPGFSPVVSNFDADDPTFSGADFNFHI